MSSFTAEEALTPQASVRPPNATGLLKIQRRGRAQEPRFIHNRATPLECMHVPWPYGHSAEGKGAPVFGGRPRGAQQLAWNHKPCRKQSRI